MKESKLEASLITTKKTNQELEVNPLVMMVTHVQTNTPCVHTHTHACMYASRAHTHTHTLHSGVLKL